MAGWVDRVKGTWKSFCDLHDVVQIFLLIGGVSSLFFGYHLVVTYFPAVRLSLVGLFMTVPTISVIVPFEGNSMHLEHCLRALDADLAALRWARIVHAEVLVVNVGKPDLLRNELLTKIVLPYHKNNFYISYHTEDVSLVGALSMGVSLTGGDYIAFISDRVAPELGTLEALLTSLETVPNIGVVGGRVLTWDGRVLEAGIDFRFGKLASGYHDWRDNRTRAYRPHETPTPSPTPTRSPVVSDFQKRWDRFRTGSGSGSQSTSVSATASGGTAGSGSAAQPSSTTSPSGSGSGPQSASGSASHSVSASGVGSGAASTTASGSASSASSAAQTTSPAAAGGASGSRSTIMRPPAAGSSSGSASTPEAGQGSRAATTSPSTLADAARAATASAAAAAGMKGRSPAASASSATTDTTTTSSTTLGATTTSTTSTATTASTPGGSSTTVASSATTAASAISPSASPSTGSSPTLSVVIPLPVVPPTVSSTTRASGSIDQSAPAGSAAGSAGVGSDTHPTQPYAEVQPPQFTGEKRDPTLERARSGPFGVGGFAAAAHLRANHAPAVPVYDEAGHTAEQEAYLHQQQELAWREIFQALDDDANGVFIPPMRWGLLYHRLEPLTPEIMLPYSSWSLREKLGPRLEAAHARQGDNQHMHEAGLMHEAERMHEAGLMHEAERMHEVDEDTFYGTQHDAYAELMEQIQREVVDDDLWEPPASAWEDHGGDAGWSAGDETKWDHGYADEGEASSWEDANGLAPLPVDRLRGYVRSDARVSHPMDVQAVRFASVGMMRRNTWNAIHGFDTATFKRTLFDVEASIKIRQQRLGVWLNPRATVVNAGAGLELHADPDVGHLLARYGDELRTEVRSTLQHTDVTVVWNMECGSGAVLGFTMEALSFLLALEKRVPVVAHISNWGRCEEELRKTGVAEYGIATLKRLHEKATMSYARDGEDAMCVLVLHRDPGRYKIFRSESMDRLRGCHTHIVGRSMFETDRISSEWVDNCNDPELVDEIWVPSKFNQATFTASGVVAGRTVVMPELVDVRVFDPAITAPMTIAGRQGFAFLSIFKWEKRKGWDILLRAFLEEFGPEEDVWLYLRANLDRRNEAELESFVKSVMEHKGRRGRAGIVVLRDVVPAHQLPSLYKAFDAFVLPTRGEGFGLPIIEAMSMGLPVIATNFSGNTEFMTPETTYFLNVSQMEESSAASGHMWARPSVRHLRELMRTVFTNRTDAARVGRRARAHVCTHYDYDASAERVMHRVSSIRTKLVADVARRKEERARSLLDPTGSGSHPMPTPTLLHPGWNRIKLLNDDD